MFRLASVVFASLLSFMAPVPAPLQDETLEWLDDYDEALALAKETGKPLFLEFRCAP